MSVSGENRKVAVIAGADLRTGAQFKCVAVGGTIAATNLAAFGILENRPNTGENATVIYDGHAKAFVGAAVSAGAALKVTTSGYLTSIASGDGAVAKALTAAGSGALCEVLCDFKTALTAY